MAEEAVKKIIVDQEACIGCGACTSEAPAYFELNNEGKSQVIKAYDVADADKIQKAVDVCPVQAISIE